MIPLEIKVPEKYASILQDSEQLGFSMPSDLQTGCLLRTLVSSKPGGSFLELGTGTGLSLAWIVNGMDAEASVISVDNEQRFLYIAEKYFSADERVSVVCEDGGTWIKNNQNKKFDLIFADTWPGKYEVLEETLSLLKNGGFYVIDDMLPQKNWPEGHDIKAKKLVNHLHSLPNFQITILNWSTGIVLLTKII